MASDTTRRHLLNMAGAASVGIAAAKAGEAEGSTGPRNVTLPFALTTPMRIADVGLRVMNLDRMTGFYRDLLGLTVLGRDEHAATLGVDGVPLLTLTAEPGLTPESGRAAGLYHTAFLMPTRKDLARWLVHVAQNRVPLTGFADHHVSEAIYLDDPEGNGIEVYSDRPKEDWRWTGRTITMGTEQLDVDDLVALTNVRVSDYAAAPSGLRIGHVHLKVGELNSGAAFYRAAIGLDETLRYGTGASFLSSGGYHHHIGVNIWGSRGAGPRDTHASGLDWFTFELENAERLAELEARLKTAAAPSEIVDGHLETRDPWGTVVRFRAA